MNKRLICLLLVALVLFSGCAESSEISIYEEGSYCLLINEPVTLYEDDSITIKVTGSRQISDTEFRLHFEASNKTDEIYEFFFLPVRINNTGVYVGGNNYLLSPSLVDEFHDFYFDLEYETVNSLKDINEIHTLSFLYYIANENEEQEHIEPDIVSISKGSLYKNMGISEEYLIGTDEYYDIYFVMAEGDRYSLLFHNKTDRILFFNLKSLAINNISVSTYYYYLVSPNSYFYYLRDNYSALLPDFETSEEVACIEVDFRYYENKYDDLSRIQSKLILNDEIVLPEPEISGDIIYDQDDIIISVETRHTLLDDSENRADYWFWNVQNISDEPCYMAIENVITSYGYGNQFENYIWYCSVLPNTSYALYSYKLNNHIPSEMGYTITADLVFFNDERNVINRETITFIVK